MRRQRNIEQTIRHTAEELSQEEKVSAEPVDEDWTTRFFNIAEDVSNEQMQQLWGRILAGEIKKPKTYSLRTLEALRNISPEEAEVFCNIGNYTIIIENTPFLLYSLSYFDKKEELNQFYTNLVEMINIGLLSAVDDIILNKEKTHDIIYGNSKLPFKQYDPKMNIKLRTFTPIGRELFQLIPQKIQNDYADWVRTYLSQKQLGENDWQLLTENRNAEKKTDMLRMGSE
ncbi:DUF2806 domain-containing protein [Desulfobulbus sp. US5]|nr:DUF2806 domain-containing protein [Desulfobulbus sp. US4]MCW5214124.1 DUF2806 domain-containing protein [Desulfobulbus sp. US5]